MFTSNYILNFYLIKEKNKRAIKKNWRSYKYKKNKELKFYSFRWRFAFLDLVFCAFLLTTDDFGSSISLSEDEDEAVDNCSPFWWCSALFYLATIVSSMIDGLIWMTTLFIFCYFLKIFKLVMKFRLYITWFNSMNRGVQIFFPMNFFGPTYSYTNF